MELNTAVVGFTGRVQGVDGRVTYGDDRHAVGTHLHGHPHHQPQAPRRPWLASRVVRWVTAKERASGDRGGRLEGTAGARDQLEKMTGGCKFPSLLLNLVRMIVTYIRNTLGRYKNACHTGFATVQRNPVIVTVQGSKI